MSARARALVPGDLVALVATSGPTADDGQAARAAAAVETLGFRVRVYPSCTARRGYLAGSDEGRARDLQDAFADPEVAGVFCIRGGYGAGRILDKLDYGAIARNPKPFAGYSDVTALHAAFSRFCGFPTFHAPMPASDFLPEPDPVSRASFLAALLSSEPLGELGNPETPPPPGSPAPKAYVGGKARGRLAGGNLSLVAAAVGTPYAVDPRGAILFLEDVGEAPYRIDRMLCHLRLAGCFDSCAGVVLGGFSDCAPPASGPSGAAKPSLSLEEVFGDLLGSLRVPVLAGLAAGHQSPSLTLPLGVVCELDADALSLRAVEAALLPARRSAEETQAR